MTIVRKTVIICLYTNIIYQSAGFVNSIFIFVEILSNRLSFWGKEERCAKYAENTDVRRTARPTREEARSSGDGSRNAGSADGRCMRTTSYANTADGRCATNVQGRSRKISGNRIEIEERRSPRNAAYERKGEECPRRDTR